jgi:Tfp pilus assembly protein PilN
VIKVNLLKNPLTGATAQVGIPSEVTDDGLGSSKNAALKNLFVILIGAVGLFAYEQVTLPNLRAQYTQLQREVLELQTKNTQAQDAVAKIENLKKQQGTIEKQIEALAQLQKNRTREIRFLDHLQTVTPARLWLTRVHVKEGSLIIGGFAATDEEVTKFLDALGQSPFLKNIGLVRSAEFSSTQLRGVKQFEVRAAYAQ